MFVAALGDSPNDIEMLKEADYPIAVMKRTGRYDAKIIKALKKSRRKINKAKGIGPEGWNRAIIELLEIFGR